MWLREYCFKMMYKMLLPALMLNLIVFYLCFKGNQLIMFKQNNNKVELLLEKKMLVRRNRLTKFTTIDFPSFSFQNHRPLLNLMLKWNQNLKNKPQLHLKHKPQLNPPQLSSILPTLISIHVTMGCDKSMAYLGRM